MVLIKPPAKVIPAQSQPACGVVGAIVRVVRASWLDWTQAIAPTATAWNTLIVQTRPIPRAASGRASK